MKGINGGKREIPEINFLKNRQNNFLVCGSNVILPLRVCKTDLSHFLPKLVSVCLSITRL